MMIGLKKIDITIKVEQPIPLRVAKKVGFEEKGIIYKNEKPYAYKLEKVL